MSRAFGGQLGETTHGAKEYGFMTLYRRRIIAVSCGFFVESKGVDSNHDTERAIELQT